MAGRCRRTSPGHEGRGSEFYPPEHQMQIDFHTLGQELQLVHTNRLALRDVCLSDAWPLFDATRNPLFNKDLQWVQPSSVEQVFARVNGIMAAARKGQLAAVSAVCRQTGQWAGMFRFLPHASGAVELGIWVHPNYWHGNIASEIAQTCGNAVFETAPQVQVLLGAAKTSNRGSCALIRRCGLEQVRTVWRKHETLDDIEVFEHELTREAWLAGNVRPKGFLKVALPSSAVSAVHTPHENVTSHPQPAANDLPQRKAA